MYNKNMSESFELSLDEIEAFHSAINEDKATKLDMVTEFVAEHGEATHETEIDIQETDTGLVITASNGLVLNEILPQNYRFTEGTTKYFWANGRKKTIEVPADFESTELSKQQLSHELGHVLDPDFESLSQEINSHWNAVVDTSDESLLNAASAVNKTLTLEINAHNHGKIVSQALGVDQVRYQDRITEQLQEYLLDGLEKLATVVDWDSESVREKEVTIIDPMTQKEMPVTLGEVETMLNKKYEK
jgi:hypothetical protein